MNCHRCERLITERAIFPFKRLCKPCLAFAVDQANDIAERIAVFQEHLGYQWQDVKELGKK